MSGVQYDEVRRRVAESVAAWDDEDVAIRVEQAALHPLQVMISSKHPSTYYNQWVDLQDDGAVHLPAPDDGFTSVGAQGTTAARATTTDEAVELVVREVSAAVRVLEVLQARNLAWHRPVVQPPVPDDALAEACRLWQGGKNVGSSPVRAAARVLSGVRHYFHAGFITDYDEQARTTPEVLAAGLALLRAVNDAPHRDANGWSTAVGVPAGTFAGRGIKSKPNEDPQIEKRLATGRINMPLWGVSLSPDVAAGFGTRFLFELVGDFPAVPAWQHSSIKDDEQELVTGGQYRVLSQEVRDGTTHVRLQWFGASGDRVGSDPLLLAVLGAAPSVVHSSLTRSTTAPQEETLELRLGGEDCATVTRAPEAQTVNVVRYWAWEPGWDAKGDDEYSQWAAMRAASRTTTEPADVEAVVAAIKTGKN
ncbi:hypothetical protein E9549_15010 [Blastococcus sp. MG754426]|uniref:hypothetical protein n=1 Tax=unclassified Blastococcus TaxID=2619396 RepID=UPI001EF10BA0|nr:MULTISPECIES: hypothetical protein [unclassified Blastococcus]MCF6508704.1 hypothetical protein [Blastococcus sp. MG754426]MCF6513313.1 hypothetical protein [Blastococcus sp. MG754427]MCF6734072.1 hypothetical protein [Blastococcus sp. KM273129]